MAIERAFDLALCATLLWVGWRALASDRRFEAVVLFIVLGLLTSLAWVRLEAPDVALAEAAIGAGLTGALLIDAVGQLGGGAARRGRGAQRTTSEGGRDAGGEHTPTRAG